MLSRPAEPRGLAFLASGASGMGYTGVAQSIARRWLPLARGSPAGPFGVHSVGSGRPRETLVHRWADLLHPFDPVIPANNLGQRYDNAIALERESIALVQGLGLVGIHKDKK